MMLIILVISGGSVSFGLGLEFPLILVFLEILGIVTPQALARQRRLALVGIVILVAVITPSGDPVSLVALAGPMYLFYEAAILFGRYSCASISVVTSASSQANGRSSGSIEANPSSRP